MGDKRTETLVVKVRPELRTWLAQRANAQLRTLSAEACLHLEAALRRDREPTGSGSDSNEVVSPS